MKPTNDKIMSRDKGKIWYFDSTVAMVFYDLLNLAKDFTNSSCNIYFSLRYFARVVFRSFLSIFIIDAKIGASDCQCNPYSQMDNFYKMKMIIIRYNYTGIIYTGFLCVVIVVIYFIRLKKKFSTN